MIDTATLNGARDSINSDFQGIVLVDSLGTEVSDVIPTSSTPDFTPTYVWDTTTDGRIQLAQDVPFSIAAGVEVAGWRAKSGTTDIGGNWTWDTGFILGEDFNTSVTFSSAGEFTLEGTPTYIQISLV